MSRVTKFDNSINKQPLSNELQIHEREWSNDLFDCCNDYSECGFAFFCPLFYMIKLTSIAAEPTCAICCGGPVPIRTKIRIERKIKGSIADDYLKLLFCPFCAMIQMSIEAENTGPII